VALPVGIVCGKIAVMSEILQARQRAGLKQHDVAAAVGRSVYVFDKMEQGLTKITPDEEAAILRAIARVAAFESAMLRRREEFLADRNLKLPPASVRTVSHVQ
jgi:transcriptional regulator with XRE-family HTH domain